MTETLPAPLPLPSHALEELAQARATLERESLTVKLSALIGTPVESFKRKLPGAAQRALDAALRRALAVAFAAAAKSSPVRKSASTTRPWFQRGLSAASGMVGGALGLPGTLVELPVSTTLLLRQILAEAVEAGEDPEAAETALECLQVFAFGGPGGQDDAVEAGYFATRLALARLLPNVGAVTLPTFLGVIAARFSGPLLLKLSAQAAPLFGAVAGATVNVVFLEHYRRLARAHFTVRRLEREYGAAAVMLAFESLRAPQAQSAERGRWRPPGQSASSAGAIGI
jgi:hypothetical protein